MTGAGGGGLDPTVQQHSFMEIDHEIFSTVILSLLLIQEGLYERAQGLVFHLED